jgi:hypothetical protein
MWRLYLHASSAAFREGVVEVHQILVSRGQPRGLPLTRDDLYSEMEVKVSGQSDGPPFLPRRIVDRCPLERNERAQETARCISDALDNAPYAVRAVGG